MKYVCPCIAVDSIEESREFYESLLGQTVKFDFGENVAFDGMFAIQLKPHFAAMINRRPDDLKDRPNNMELTFETEDLDAFLKTLDASKFAVRRLHDVIEHPWGQRVIRFYDPSDHIVEVGEAMSVVVTRFLEQGMTVEEAAARTQFPVDFVAACRDRMNGEDDSP